MYTPSTTGTVYQKQLDDLIAKSRELQERFPMPVLQPYTHPVIAPHIDYVHGIDGAKRFLENMPAGGKAVLMDEDEAKFYVVSKDANGTPAQIAFANFTLEFEEEPKEPMFVTKQDFDDFRTEMLEILSRRGDGA